MRFILVFLVFSLIGYGQKNYQKNYFNTGILKSEGWIKNGEKTNYWKFYYENRSLKKEGHYANDNETKYWYFYHLNGIKKTEGHYSEGKKYKWWIYYDTKEEISHKCQFKNNLKDGYCLIYKDGKLVSAQKYKEDKLIKEWTDMETFKKENNLIDLK